MSSHATTLPRRSVSDAAYLVTGLPLGVAAFSVVVTGLALAAGLAITVVGIPILLATLLLTRGFAAVERRRAELVLGEPVRGDERPLTGSVWARTKTIATDPASWRDALWSLLLLPVGVAGFTVAVTVWSTALGLLTSPAWSWAVDEDPDESLALFNSTAVGYSALRVVIGIALVPVAYVVSRWVAVGSARLARALLGRG